MGSAPALKCSDYRFESSLAGYLDKGSVHWKGRPKCECTGVCTLGGITLWASVHWGELRCGQVYTEGANFFNLYLKLINQKQSSHMFIKSLKLTNHRCLTAKCGSLQR